VPPERLESALQDLVALRRPAVVEVHAEPIAHGVEAPVVRVAHESGDAGRGPLGTDVVRRAKRGRVVDDGAAAEARPGEQRDPLVVRGDRPAFEV
jgi:hypothetical protein